jgi:hypothetical protein
MSNTRRFTAIGLAVLLVIPGWAANPLPMPMPDFQVARSDGTTISTTQIPQSGKWFVIYTKQNCASCDRFLRIFSKTEIPDLPSHMVIVVSGAPTDKLGDYAGKFRDLAEALWYADPSERGMSPLQIKGMPVIFGVHDNTLAWSIMGVPSGDTARLKAILKSWITP